MLEFLVIVLVIMMVVMYWLLDNRIQVLERQIKNGVADSKKTAMPIIEPHKQEIPKVVPIPAIPLQQTRTAQVSTTPVGVKVGSVNVQATPAVVAQKTVSVTAPVPTSKVPKKNYEFQFGGNVLTIIGSIAVLFGVGFFLRYAFVNDLISETVRVIMGLLVGIILIIIGEVLRKKYAVYGQLLTGSGVGILYLSTYAAWNFYQLVSVVVAFVGLLVVTSIGVFLAARANSKALAGISQLGGFLTPLLLSSGGGSDLLFMIYVVLLSGGFLAIAYWKKWRIFTYTSFAVATFLYLFWFPDNYTDGKFIIAESFATVLFILYLSVAIVNYLKKLTLQDGFDLAMATLTPIFFLITNGKLLEHSHAWYNIFLFSLATLYLIIAVYLPGIDNISARFRLFMAGVSSLLFVLLVPAIFNGSWVTIAWAVEAAILIYIGLVIKSRVMRIFGHALFFVAFVRLLFSDTFVNIAYPIFNLRTLTYLLVIFAFVFAIWAYEKYKASFVGKNYQIETSYLLLASSLALIVGGSRDIQQFFDQSVMTIFWSLVFLLLIGVAFLLRNVVLRIFALTFSLFVFISLFTVEIFATGAPIVNGRFLSYAAFLVACLVVAKIISARRNTLLPNEFPLVTSVIFLQAYFIAVRWVTIESQSFFSQKPLFFYTALGLLAAVAMYVGLRYRNIVLRIAVYLTYISLPIMLVAEKFSIVAPILNERVFSVIIASVAAGSAILLLHLYQEKIRQEINITKSVLLVEGYLLLVWLISAEADQFFRNQSLFIFSLYSLLALAGGLSALKLRNLSLRISVYATFALLLLTNLISVWDSEISRLLINERILGALFVILGAWVFKMLLEKSNDQISPKELKVAKNTLFFGSNFIIWSLMNREIMDYFSKNNLKSEPGVISLKDVFISIGWTVYALVLLVLGILKRSSLYRLSAIFLLIIAILKVFLYDAMGLNDLYRFVSFISLGIILLLAGFLYYRYRDRIMHFIEAKV